MAQLYWDSLTLEQIDTMTLSEVDKLLLSDPDLIVTLCGILAAAAALGGHQQTAERLGGIINRVKTLGGEKQTNACN